MAVSQGAHPNVIQERLGHSSIEVTLDTYGHLFPDLDEAVAAWLDELARTAAASAPQRRLLLGSSPRSQAEVANDQRIVVGAEGFEPPASSL